MPDNTIGPRAPVVVVPNPVQGRPGPEANAPAPAADSNGWRPGAAGATVRSDAPQAAAATAGPDHSATRELVRNLNGQLATENGKLTSLQEQLSAARQRLSTDEHNQGMRDRMRGGSPQVKQGREAIARLEGSVAGAQATVAGLQKQIDGAVLDALKGDPAYKARAAQLTTLTRADAATTAFLTQIDGARSAISAAQTAQTANNVGDIAGALLGTSNDSIARAGHEAAEANKKAKLAVAGAKVNTLGAQTDAWKATIEAITNEQVSTGGAGNLDVRLGTFLPLVREFVSPDLATGFDTYNDISNAIALGKAAKKVDTLRQGVQGYSDEVGSKKRQLDTTQNNALIGLRTQLLQ